MLKIKFEKVMHMIIKWFSTCGINNISEHVKNAYFQVPTQIY